MDLCNKNKTTDPFIQTISWWTQPCTEIAAPTLGRSLVEMKLSIICQWEELGGYNHRDYCPNNRQRSFAGYTIDG
jgi:hypothetical protein